MHRQITTAFSSLGTVALKHNLILSWVQVYNGTISHQYIFISSLLMIRFSIIITIVIAGLRGMTKARANAVSKLLLNLMFQYFWNRMDPLN